MSADKSLDQQKSRDNVFLRKKYNNNLSLQLIQYKRVSMDEICFLISFPGRQIIWKIIDSTEQGRLPPGGYTCRGPPAVVKLGYSSSASPSGSAGIPRL